MALECPACRAPVSFWRSITKTAWSRFPCKACGSILSIDLKWRLLALIPWLACVLFLMFVAHVQQYGSWVFVGTLIVCFLAIYYRLENIVLIERRAFCCRKCGYELEGLPEPRCPECGTPFDPAEKERIRKRLGQPPPRARHRWVVVLLILLLLGTLIANYVTYRRGVGPPPPPANPQTSP